MTEEEKRANFRSEIADKFQNAREPVYEPERLTTPQYQLLGTLYYKSHEFAEDGENSSEQRILDRILTNRFPGKRRVEGVYLSTRESHPILWSPKRLLGKLTPKESASVSRNIKKLRERRLVTLENRIVTVTKAGRDALQGYENKNLESDSLITVLLFADEIRDTIALIAKVALLAKKHGMPGLITDQPGALPDLLNSVIESMSDESSS